MKPIKIGDLLKIDIDDDTRPSHGEKELLHRVIAMLKHQGEQIDALVKAQKHNERLIRMIPQTVIDATKQALNDATQNIINHLPGNTTPSTPDAAVQGLIDNVNANVNAMNAAAGPATPPPPTP